MASDVPVGPPVVPPLDRRAADLRRLADERWDLLIVGGGIVGVGALLDATSRGLRVALVEQDDIASGTSSRSSRLIHGGLRYLQHYQFGVVRESLAERARLLRLAPHLVRLNEFLFPLRGLPIVSAGLLRLRHAALRRARVGEVRRTPSPPSTTSTLEYAPHLRRNGPARRPRLPRRGRRRRASRRRRRADRRRARGRGGDRGHPGPGDGRDSRRRPGLGGPRSGPGVRRDRRAPCRPRGRRDRRLGIASRPAVRRRLAQRRSIAGQPHPRAARAHPGSRRDHAAHPRPRRVHGSVAAPLDHRHDR